MTGALVLLLVFASLLGLAIGSFLNVVVYRVPAGRSLTPDSACPKCGTAIRKRDNIPVLSWLLLRGRCRGCHEPISARYPLVEAGTAVAFLLVTARFGPAVLDAATATDAVAGAIELVAFLVLTAVSIALALIDLDTKRLPNAIVVPTLIAGTVLLAAAALVRGDLVALAGAALGGAGLFVLYLVLALVSRGGMGMGDVKLAAVLGLYLGFLGWGNLLVGAFAAFVFGGVFGLALMLIRRAGRRSAIPFGPWMILGAWLGIFAGELLARSYFDAVGVG
ncbi:MAG: prepilin peptidase [Microbacteriaceae bacterium]|nr:prepilin peptidase [Microbacteriaceae bacterium]